MRNAYVSLRECIRWCVVNYTAVTLADTPRTCRIHALHSGLSLREYAEQVGVSHVEVRRWQQAAMVYTKCYQMVTTLDIERWRHLAEIGSAPEHTWPTLA